MATSAVVAGVAGATDSLLEMLENPWGYFPHFIGGDLVSVGQVGPSRFIVAFGRSWTKGTPTATSPPRFSSVQTGGPRVFEVDSHARQADEITPSLLLAPNASLRAAVVANSGMHLIASTGTGTHVQFIQNFAHSTLRSLSERPLTPSVWANGEEHPVEWDRGAAHHNDGFFAIGADSNHQLYVTRVRTTLTRSGGYDPSRRSYLSATGWTNNPAEQNPLLRSDGTPLTSPVPAALFFRRQNWLILIPKKFGNTWGWELLRSRSLNHPFRHVMDLPGESATPTPARFLPGLVLENDRTKTPGVAWTYSVEKPDSFVPNIGQLQVS